MYTDVDDQLSRVTLAFEGNLEYFGSITPLMKLIYYVPRGPLNSAKLTPASPLRNLLFLLPVLAPLQESPAQLKHTGSYHS